MIKKVRLNLSKSLYIKGKQCYKALWLSKYFPEYKTPPSEAKLLIFEQGKQIGKLAHKLFPNGYDIEENAVSFGHKLKLTSDAVNKGCKTLYEATFSYNNTLIMADIMHKNKRKNTWELYEVKSSTSKKEVHINDISLQHYILMKMGINISDTFIIHINNQYKRKILLNTKKLFSIINVTEETQGQLNGIEQSINSMRSMLKNTEPPEIDIGPHCLQPYECDFKNHCWSHIPKNSIFTISSLSLEDKFNIYKKGYIRIRDLPEDFPLTETQSIQVTSEKTGVPHINKKKLKSFIDSLYYPLYFLDFETMQDPVPQFNNSVPYKQIPFQYSLHWLNSPFDTLNHTEFLAKEGKDPRNKIALSLIKNIPENCCILAYNAGVEKNIILNLANYFPRLNKKLMKIYDNIYDLMIPFQKNYIYTKEMEGSNSIKNILPALVTDLNYSLLSISNGELASYTYKSLKLEKDKEKINKAREALLEYCKLDTYAMYKILEKLKSLVS
ncbi:MAG: DUF2779 domain-containing protein [bacterium]|nr:DUF2779 domain-containing protein [bacterium]